MRVTGFGRSITAELNESRYDKDAELKAIFANVLCEMMGIKIYVTGLESRESKTREITRGVISRDTSLAQIYRGGTKILRDCRATKPKPFLDA